MICLYVHIPFCRERCPYCDFFLVTKPGFVERFFEALAVETTAKASLFAGQAIEAIHFGGGTPSLVSPSFIDAWLSQISGLAQISSETEITLEANPEDLSPASLDALQALGVNRLSIGVQSFADRKLKALGRAHSAADARRVVSEALERFRSVSIDLMCGAGGETLAEWESDLRAALDLRLQHISVYMLTLEEKTRLWRDVRKGLRRLPGEEAQAAMYRLAAELLCGAGYGHYEISNFALEGRHSRYNLASWMREPYLGFGPAAHSFLVSGEAQTRFSNASSLTKYLADPAGAVDFREALTDEQRFDEQVFLSLRIRKPLSVGFLRKGHKLGHQHLDSVLVRLQEQGWIGVESGEVSLTEAGFLFADLVAAELLSA
ncbi:radical SAM family heme chaperone HemW [Chlorobaculum thiosulfatiphilum]|uniref:Heme chaperone HemW n=1 Tax=Chlorobaculum thiosulfatiphilum TaxID=115852 RepID=A0A5C4SA32_CHLTI|nr:radical SAM family heme chaperone HemW [Chlorobaculum thiosulfatiphilum]TNJ40047.1 radical SAM family heme chaperone HemW [Chlorobaculum thiosulfatiphilum]